MYNSEVLLKVKCGWCKHTIFYFELIRWKRRGDNS